MHAPKQQVKNRLESVERLSKRQMRRGAEAYPEAGHERPPRTVGECVEQGLGRVRPCGWVSCSYHLALDTTENGSIYFNVPVKNILKKRGVVVDAGGDSVPEIDLRSMRDTCALAVAERGGLSLRQMSALLGVSFERVRQIEDAACAKLRSQMAENDGGQQ